MQAAKTRIAVIDAQTKRKRRLQRRAPSTTTASSTALTTTTTVAAENEGVAPRKKRVKQTLTQMQPLATLASAAPLPRYTIILRFRMSLI